MKQLGNKVVEYDQNKSTDLFNPKSILNSMPYGVALFDENLHLTDWNNNFLTILGFNAEKVVKNTNIKDLFRSLSTYKEEDNSSTIDIITEMFQESTSTKQFNWHYKYFLSDKQEIELTVEFFPNKGLITSLTKIKQKENHQLIEFQAAKDYLESQTRDAIYMAEDLAVAQEEAARAAQHTQTILNAMEEGLVTLNENGKIISSNNAMSVIFGYPPSEIEGMELHNIIVSSDIQTSQETQYLLDNQIDGFNVYKSDEKGRRKDGSQLPLKIEIREVFLGEEKHYTVLFRNVTEQFEAEKLIRQMAWHDSLTGLANRNLLSDRLNEALKMASRIDRKVCVMLLDLDKFKPVNDLFGHSTGDKLLKVVSERLLNCAREVDTVARLGGDEFAIIFTSIEDEKNIIKIADRIIQSLQEPTEIDGNVIQIGTSIGISFYPSDADTPAELIRMADVALYQAKDDGRRIFRLYDPQMDAESKTQKQIEIDLNKALENNELLLHYQPQINAGDNKLIAAEALIRWNHPEKGMISPYEFIPVAELCGLMIPIGQWVLNTACKATKEWQKKGLPYIRICVNISARQFQADNFVDTIKEALKFSRLSPCWLELEITEGMVIKNTDTVVTKLEQLKELGIHLSIDDFGTGYSSLAYLKRFPVDTLKIDQSFIRNIHKDPDDAAITDAVIRLGHSLGLSVVGEGVETEEHVKVLREKGCDVLQGYHFCRPIPYDEFEKYLKNYS